MLTDILVLLVIYQFKHFFADYPLQGKYMLGKFKPGWDFLGPLAAHCGVHAAMTFVISYSYFLGVYGINRYVLLPIAGMAFILSALDFISHFGMDRFKASPKLLGRFKAMSGQEYMSNYQMLESIKPLIAAQSKLDAFDLSNGAALAMLLKDKEACERKIKHNAFFWWALGLDQMWHHLTHYAIIAVLMAQ